MLSWQKARLLRKDIGALLVDVFAMNKTSTAASIISPCLQEQIHRRITGSELKQGTYRWGSYAGVTVHFMMCVCVCAGVGRLMHARSSLHIAVHKCSMHIFLWLRVQAVFPHHLSFFLIQWKIPRLPLCRLRKQRGCNQSSGCFSRNPLCLSLHCFPIKGTLITGNSAGNRAPRWEVGMEKVERTRLLETSL